MQLKVPSGEQAPVRAPAPLSEPPLGAAGGGAGALLGASTGASTGAEVGAAEGEAGAPAPIPTPTLRQLQADLESCIRLLTPETRNPYSGRGRRLRARQGVARSRQPAGTMTHRWSHRRGVTRTHPQSKVQNSELRVQSPESTTTVHSPRDHRMEVGTEGGRRKWDGEAHADGMHVCMYAYEVMK